MSVHDLIKHHLVTLLLVAGDIFIQHTVTRHMLLVAFFASKGPNHGRMADGPHTKPLYGDLELSTPFVCETRDNSDYWVGSFQFLAWKDARTQGRR